ncbi:hypothetical protein P3T36_002847 [Kitasatospora sp. MAP12-15]|uniref:hypothetical protein n=1 Tax=unclassified Kitasatospora TaxID=2633591 RepID=UPI002473B2F1|nr:hypothetical protein [Kitasatospora sp. MAP12-44]MDH6114026.1 hypothetical protein [Kitasatospora sp. MAP12-44]
MIAISRRLPITAALAGLPLLLVTGCGSSPSSTATAPIPPAAAPAVTGTPSSSDGTSGGTLTLTGTGGAAFHFDNAACLGKKDPAGDIVLTATSSTDGATAVLSFQSGKPSLLLTPSGSSGTIWSTAGDAAPGTASRTVDTITLKAMPVSQLTGQSATASGTLTCSGTQALL